MSDTPARIDDIDPKLITELATNLADKIEPLVRAEAEKILRGRLLGPGRAIEPLSTGHLSDEEIANIRRHFGRSDDAAPAEQPVYLDSTPEQAAQLRRAHARIAAGEPGIPMEQVHESIVEQIAAWRTENAPTIVALKGPLKTRADLLMSELLRAALQGPIVGTATVVLKSMHHRIGGDWHKLPPLTFSRLMDLVLYDDDISRRCEASGMLAFRLPRRKGEAHRYNIVVTTKKDPEHSP